MKKIFLLCSLLITIASQAQIRERSNTKGLNAGASFHVLGWTSEYFQYLDENAGSGIGGGLRAGYGITQLIEPYVAIDFTSMGVGDVDAQSFKMTHIDLGVRFNFAGTTSAVRPFVQGGYSSRIGKIDQVVNGNDYSDVKFYGGTPHVGGGLNYFLKPGISLFAQGLFTIGKDSNLELNGTKVDEEKADVTTFRIGVGVQFNISSLLGN